MTPTDKTRLTEIRKSYEALVEKGYQDLYDDLGFLLSLLSQETKRADEYRRVMEENYESMVANLYVFGMVREELKKIEGPDWDVIIESMDEIQQKAQDVMAAAVSRGREGESR